MWDVWMWEPWLSQPLLRRVIELPDRIPDKVLELWPDTWRRPAPKAASTQGREGRRNQQGPLNRPGGTLGKAPDQPEARAGYGHAARNPGKDRVPHEESLLQLAFEAARQDHPERRACAALSAVEHLTSWMAADGYERVISLFALKRGGG